MRRGPRRTRWALTLAPSLITLGAGSIVDFLGLVDGAKFGVRGAPIAVVHSPDDELVFVAAADNPSILVLGADDGVVLDRQPMAEVPAGLAWVPIRQRPIVFFHRSPWLCEVHPFLERTLGTCMAPGQADAPQPKDRTPLVLGVAADGDRSLMVALGRVSDRVQLLRLRRFDFDPARRVWYGAAESPWLVPPTSVEYAGPWPIAVATRSGQVLVAVPGTGRLLVFATNLAFQQSIEIGTDLRALVVRDDPASAYVGDARRDEVIRVSLPDLEVTARAKAGSAIAGIAIDDEANIAWVAARHADLVDGLDLDSLARRARVRATDGAAAVAVARGQDELEIASPRGGSVASWATVSDASGPTDPESKRRWNTEIP